jgi:hydrogenase-4 component B
MVATWSFPLLAGAGLGYALGGVVAGAGGRWPIWSVRLAYGLATCASGLTLLAGILALLDPRPQTTILLTTNAQWGLQLALRLDPLAAFFLLLLGVGGIAISLYAGGYVRVYVAHGKRVALFTCGYNLFWLAMVGVVVANNVFGFLLAWESMSLVSYLLVSFEHEHEDVRRSGLLYLVTTHIGTAFLMGAFALLAINAHTSFGFDAIRALPHVPADTLLQSAIFLGALIGFGTKAGIMPMHFWLPRAHPVAPGPISAIMSGVMLKMAIYGLLRVVGDLLLGGSAPPLWWGIVIVALGAVSAPLGALLALVETDLKRLLAYSSIENMGILFLCLGTAFIAQTLNLPALATLAFGALLLHSLNHLVFKSLLFMGAGAIQHAAHTTNLEAMGGLIKRLPKTAILVFVGCLAGAGIPPFNGFVSEWLTFQTLIGLISHSQDLWGKVGAVSVLSAFALTATLATATFLKVFGVAFLARPRHDNAANAQEVGRAQVRGMALMAGLAALLGVSAGAVLWLLTPVLDTLTSGRMAALPGAWSLPTALHASANTASAWIPLAILLPLVLSAACWALWRQREPARRVATWACGGQVTPRMEYTALAFAKSFLRVFGGILHGRHTIATTYTLEPYVVAEMQYRHQRASWLDDPRVRRLQQGVTHLLDQVIFVQNGSVRLYLGYILLTLVALLIFAR